MTAAIFAGFALLIIVAGAFYFISSMAHAGIYSYLLLAVALIIFALFALNAYLIYSGKISNGEPDYRMLFMIGIIFLPIAFSSDALILPVMSLAFIAIGLWNKKKWKKEPKWSEMPPGKRIVIVALMIALAILVIVTFASLYLEATKNNEKENNKMRLSVQEARSIAERDCIKGGDSLSSVMYNENTKTWWFDANLHEAREGCNPACVVSEALLSAEINWRCTGLIPPTSASGESIRKLFVQKYPKYADSVSVTVEKETEDHARGSVNFVSGAPGGIFLAARIDGAWQIVFDGNGEISCDLSKYGFPSDMLSDCS